MSKFKAKGINSTHASGDNRFIDLISFMLQKIVLRHWRNAAV